MLNNIDILVLIFIALASVLGFVRGVLFSFLRLVRTAIGMFLCFYFSSYYTQPVYDAFVKPKLLEVINEKIVVSGNIDEIITNLNNYVKSFPSFIADKLNVSSINISSDDIALSILNSVFEPVAIKVTRVLLFISVFIVFFVATGILLFFLKRKYDKKNKEGKTSAIKKTDKLFGTVFGAFKGCVIVLAVFCILSLAVSFNNNPSQDNSVLIALQGSKIFNYVNNINPFNVITEGLL